MKNLRFLTPAAYGPTPSSATPAQAVMTQGQRPCSPRRQRGATLFIVLIFVILSTLMVLWASRSALFSEMVVGNDVDYQRAFEAAQALMQDAELDVREETSTGTPCSGGTCRSGSGALQLPLEKQNVDDFVATLEGEPSLCQNALCTKRMGRQDFWNYDGSATTPAANTALGEVPFGTMTAVGARYGQYTGAGQGSEAEPINPILRDTSATGGGWYWIEVLPYNTSSGKNSRLITAAAGAPDVELLNLDMDPPNVYRITAIANGRRANTRVVLQETYVRQRTMN